MGLEVLYPTHKAGSKGKAAVPRVDIVLLHGLNGDPRRTWTHPKTNAFWPELFLPLDVPHARIMTFGYNAAAAFGNTTADIVDHARDLLSSLVDERSGDEQERPLILLGHSMGGIVIKQALFLAQGDPRYKSISNATVGIIFMGTPHRGSSIAAYGKVLARVATASLNKPSPRLLEALEINSPTLARLTEDFKLELSKYQVYSFYEMRPLKPLKSLVVEKTSALLSCDNEEQIPVDTDHREICRFADRKDETYSKIVSRILRMIDSSDENDTHDLDTRLTGSYNKHYRVPFNLSSVFTGRDDLIKEIQRALVPRPGISTPAIQRRFVLYGLGGSGKTQAALRFAQEFREQFWGVFWVDANSQTTAEQGVVDAARAMRNVSDLKSAKFALANAPDKWLLIIDNADDPNMDLQQFFPPGDRGTILVTTRNQDCRVHSTTGSHEVGQLDEKEAVTLLLRTAGSQDPESPLARQSAVPVVKTLGYLALAVAQAGSYIRNGRCRVDEYCDMYASHRKTLLAHQSVQASSDYKFTVYTTWELSIKALEEMADTDSKNAVHLLGIIGFMHNEKVAEEIFRRAWKEVDFWSELSDGVHGAIYARLKSAELWNPAPFRAAVFLLKSFSLISTDATDAFITIHPLVHTWARDRLPAEVQGRYLKLSSIILAVAIPRGKQEEDYRFARALVPHVETCSRLGRVMGSLEGTDADDVTQCFIADRFAACLNQSGLPRATLVHQKLCYEASKRAHGETHSITLCAMVNLSLAFDHVGLYSEALKIAERLLALQERVSDREDVRLLDAKQSLARCYNKIGRRDDALNLREEIYRDSQKILGEDDERNCEIMLDLAESYTYYQRHNEALKLARRSMEVRRNALSNEFLDWKHTNHVLARAYAGLDDYAKAAEVEAESLQDLQRHLGEEHPDTLTALVNLAGYRIHLGDVQKSIEILERVVSIWRCVSGEDEPKMFLALDNLAWGYYCVGQDEKARECGTAATEGLGRLLGSEHPYTLEASRSLREIYRAEKSPQRGEPAKHLEAPINTSRQKRKTLSHLFRKVQRS